MSSMGHVVNTESIQSYDDEAYDGTDMILDDGEESNCLTDLLSELDEDKSIVIKALISDDK